MWNQIFTILVLNDTYYKNVKHVNTVYLLLWTMKDLIIINGYHKTDNKTVTIITIKDGNFTTLSPLKYVLILKWKF